MYCTGKKSTFRHPVRIPFPQKMKNEPLQANARCRPSEESVPRTRHGLHPARARGVKNPYVQTVGARGVCAHASCDVHRFSSASLREKKTRSQNFAGEKIRLGKKVFLVQFWLAQPEEVRDLSLPVPPPFIHGVLASLSCAWFTLGGVCGCHTARHNTHSSTQHGRGGLRIYDLPTSKK